MDNMLLSLNPDSPSFFSSPPSQSRYPTSSHLSSPPKTSGSRGHKQSASLNSAFTYPSNPSDVSPSRDLPRSRRSQSSSNFPTSAGIDSITEHVQSTSGQSASTQPRASTSVPSTRSGARKGSKSSGSSSADFGHAMINTRWQPFNGRRSSSFDHSHARAMDQVPSNIPTLPGVKPSQRSIDLDAAPTPTVLGGPGGREPSPSRPNHALSETLPVGPPHTFAAREGVASSGSDGRGIYRRSVRGGAGVNSKRSSQHVSSIRGFVNSRAGSPNRAVSDQSVAMPPPINRTSKEKPGFFRRVFGSKTMATQEHRSSDTPPTRDGSQLESRSGRSSSARVQKQAPGEDSDTCTTQPPRPVLTKKPSSFFRRRKKSVSERTVTPTLPPHLQTPVRLKTMTAMADGPAQGSPVSSLHEAMDSFLSMPDQTRQPLESRTTRKKAHNEENPVPIDTAVYRSYINTTPSPKSSFTHDRNINQDYVPSKLGDNAPIRTDTLQLPDRSFLHDNSSNEDKTNDPDSEAGAVSINTDNDDQTMPGRTENRLPAGWKRGAGTSKTPTQPVLQPLGERDLNIPESQAQPKSGDDTAHGQSDVSNTSHGDATRRAFLPTVTRGAKEANANSILPISSKDVPISPISDYQSATSEISQIEADDHLRAPADVEPFAIAQKSAKDIDGTVTAPEQQLAQSVFDGDESLVVKDKVAAWLGEASEERASLRKAYMKCFDFQDLSILAAFREVCARLILKGETQQVDRILDAFSCRWCQCNPEHGFKATGESNSFNTLHRLTMWQTSYIPSVIQYYSSTLIYTWPTLTPR